jgi:ATP synthase in type III secretion protein N
MTELPKLYAAADGWRRRGTVLSAQRTIVNIRIPACRPGWLVKIYARGGQAFARVRSSSAMSATCELLEERTGVGPGDIVECEGAEAGAYVGRALCGAETNAWGDAANPAQRGRFVALSAPPPPSTRDRIAIERTLLTGIAAIDLFATLGYGQRIALFAGAGVGKSSLLRRIVTHARVDARVVALIGERGREARETADALRATHAWPTATVVCAPAGSPAVERVAALHTATAQAEWLRSRGLDVLLVVDSLTRTAHALRELALAGGEPPAQRGYPPSVAADLGAAVERVGARNNGTITAVYAVLVDGDDRTEPVSDAIRGMLDGHVVLDRAIADAGRFPAIDVLRSLSRLMPALAAPQHKRDAALARRALDALERARDLFALGAYQPGGDPWLDAAVSIRDELESLVYDGDADGGEDAIARLRVIASTLETAV